MAKQGNAWAIMARYGDRVELVAFPYCDQCKADFTAQDQSSEPDAWYVPIYVEHHGVYGEDCTGCEQLITDGDASADVSQGYGNRWEYCDQKDAPTD